MAVVSPTRRARIAASFRAHRYLITSVALVIVVVLAAFETGVRVVTPDTMELTEYQYGTNAILYHKVVIDPTQIITTYQALTRTPADWVSRFVSGAPPSPATCQQFTLIPDEATLNSLLVVRFLWHGRPVAVVSHYPTGTNPYWLWTCQHGMTEWQVSAGGIVNPRPYVDDSAVTLFPYHD